jgi:hypothetical protein
MKLERAELDLAGCLHKTGGKYILHDLEQVDLMTIQEGLELLQRKYQRSIDEHRNNCMPRQCELMKLPKDGLTCAEDLMFLYDQMSKIHQMLFLIQGEGL